MKITKRVRFYCRGVSWIFRKDWYGIRNYYKKICYDFGMFTLAVEEE